MTMTKVDMIAHLLNAQTQQGYGYNRDKFNAHLTALTYSQLWQEYRANRNK